MTERQERDLAAAGPGSPRKHPASYIRDPKRKQKVRQARAAERTAAAIGRPLSEQLKRLIARGHGHCAEAVRIQKERVKQFNKKES